MGGATTIVLVGCTGNGKSATGNSILGRKAFKSKSSSQVVTTDCQLHSAQLQDGQILNVIDTPGLFDSSMSPQSIEKEIIRCINMAKDGIHAILIVVSLRVRFSKEQANMVDTWKHLFGTRILDYMIVAFTGGDELEEDETLDDYLALECPEALKELLGKCGNRRLVFDNKTNDEDKKSKQVHQLLIVINEIAAKNGGKSYTHELLVEFKNEDAKKGFGYSKQAYNKEHMQPSTAKLVHKKLNERNEETIKEDYVKLEKTNEEMINKSHENLAKAHREDNKHAKVDENIIENVEIGEATRPKTIVLVGCTGNGKSATGNSILGRKAFKSMSSSQVVTTNCQMHSTQLQDGQILNVIDTPGLFDSSMSPQSIEKEIIRCINMAKDGIHAILIVVSLRVRFSKEQANMVDTWKYLFGTRILDYMIVAFTGGDELEENETLDDYLALECPEALKELLEKCGNRRVSFDNKTKDEEKKSKQVHQLLTLINEIVAKNGGKPYTHELLVEFKNEDAKKGFEYSKQAYNEEHMQPSIAELVHKKLNERNEEIITKLKEDYVKLEKTNEEIINQLHENLARACREDNKHAKVDENAIENAENEIRKLKRELDNVRKQTTTRPYYCAML